MVQPCINSTLDGGWELKMLLICAVEIGVIIWGRCVADWVRIVIGRLPDHIPGWQSDVTTGPLSEALNLQLFQGLSDTALDKNIR